MKPELFGDRVLIKPDIPINITKGGIFIPDSASRLDEKKTGIVICHGEGFTDESTGELFPIAVWEGCKVSVAAYLGEEFLGSEIGMEDNEIYLLINERDIDVILIEGYGFSERTITYTAQQMAQMKDFRDNGMPKTTIKDMIIW